MDSRKKGMAVEIVAKLGGKKPAGPSPDSDKEEDYEGDAETAAQELIDAVKSGDVAAVVEAFTALKAAC